MCLRIQYHRLLVGKPTILCNARKIIYKGMFVFSRRHCGKYFIIWSDSMFCFAISLFSWTAIVSLDRQHALRQHALRHNLDLHTHICLSMYTNYTHIYIYLYISTYVYKPYIHIYTIILFFFFLHYYNIMTLNLNP